MLVSMAGMDGWFDDAVGGLVKVATLPITLPWLATKEIVSQGAGALRGVQAAIKAPPPPPPPGAAPADIATMFGLGGSSASAAPSKLPYIIGGVAVVGLLAAALLMRRRT
jgi:MYXO-CTERM domain-containing protein